MRHALLLLLAVSSCRCDDGLAVIPGAVSGRVCGAEDGQGVPGAEVRLTGKDGVEHSTLTDPDGGYLFDRVLPGAVTLVAGDRTFEAVVESGKQAIVEDTACRELVDSNTGVVDGQICNRHTGSVVRDGLVILILADTSTLETRTGDDGAFRIEDAPPGRHVLVVQATGFERSFVVDVVAGETTTLALGDGCAPTGFDEGTLSGALCDPSDEEQPLVGATVTAVDADGNTATDLTDLEGEFFLAAMAPGSARVDVTRGAELLQTYFVTVVAGRDTHVALELSCAAECDYDVAAVATVTSRPVDIVFVIDDSGSMDDDNDAVRDNINDFSARIASSGVDTHVIVVGTTDVPAPLGGSEDLLQIDTNVDSNDALIELVEHYDDYRTFLRADSVKHFIAITDDESDMSASAFAATVNAWPGFEDWVFHSIVAYGSDPDEGCSTGAAYGHQYVDLSAQTGGLTSPICDANYAEVFDAVVAAVLVGSLPCSIPIPAPPGVSIDPTRVYVRHSSAVASDQVLATCNGPGWRLDDAQNPTAVEACPETCTALSDDTEGSIAVEVGCFAQ